MAHRPLRTRQACARLWLAGAALTLIAQFASPRAWAGSAFDDFDPLTVRVYDLGGVDAARLAEALVEAQVIFADAGIPSAWHDCTRGVKAPSLACVEDRRASDLIVRILRRPPDTRGTLPTALGVSVVEAGPRAGTLATVFLDLVEPVARRSGTDVHTLLGRAMAHEIGHLLLGTSGHSASGLMRETWTDRELGRNDERDWLFGPAERGLLREARLRVARQAQASE